MGEFPRWEVFGFLSVSPAVDSVLGASKVFLSHTKGAFMDSGNSFGIWIAAVMIFLVAFGVGMVVMMSPTATGGQQAHSLLGKWTPVGPVPSTIEFTSDSVIITVKGRPYQNYRIRYETVTTESNGKTFQDILVIPTDASGGHPRMRAMFFGNDSMGYGAEGDSNGVICNRVK
jgi:hypothetical protein